MSELQSNLIFDFGRFTLYIKILIKVWSWIFQIQSCMNLSIETYWFSVWKNQNDISIVHSKLLLRNSVNHLLSESIDNEKSECLL